MADHHVSEVKWDGAARGTTRRYDGNVRGVLPELEQIERDSCQDQQRHDRLREHEEQQRKTQDTDPAQCREGQEEERGSDDRERQRGH